MLPRLAVMLQVEGIRDRDDNHIEILHEDNQLPAVSPGKADMIVGAAGENKASRTQKP